MRGRSGGHVFVAKADKICVNSYLAGALKNLIRTDGTGFGLSLRSVSWPFVLRNIAFSICGWLLCLPADAATYEVGPGRAYTNIGAVAWESLQAGDTVLIHWRTNVYKEKWVLCRQGASNAPITVRGVPGPNGELPVIDGNGATTRAALSYWNENRGIIKIGGANVPPDTTPRYIVVENLDLRSARPPFTYRSTAGATQSYINNASAIYVEKGENITVRNCLMHDCGNGFFVASSDALASRDILVESNYIFDNGNDGSLFEHNNYTAAINITFQYNRFGPLRSGALGNNLKDRSAGLVVRYNWIEGGNRQLDLVNGEDSSLIRVHPLYGQTLVYGNVLIEPDAAGNRQIVHYGGDTGSSSGWRKGTLDFYNNTIVSTRADRTTLFRLSSNDESCDCRNNIVYVTAAGSTLSLLDDTGRLNLTHNWLKPGWVNSFGTLSGTITNDGSNLNGTSPGFLEEARQIYFLATNSACRDAGAALRPAVLPSNNVTRHYFPDRASVTRPNVADLDIGAYEFSPLEVWRHSKFGTNSTNFLIAGDTVDPDFDGANNLIEFANTTEPLLAGSFPRVTAAISNGYLTLGYLRPEPAPPEVAYEADTSADLISWCIGCATPVAATNLTNGTARVTVRDDLPTNARHFLRLRVRRL